MVSTLKADTLKETGRIFLPSPASSTSVPLYSIIVLSLSVTQGVEGCTHSTAYRSEATLE